MAAIDPPAEEYFDVLNPDGTRAGYSRSRSCVHAEGLWHRSTHVWVLSRTRREVLLQRRAAGKDTYPACWDVSAAGHITAGDESSATALREIEEELGLRDGRIEYLFTSRAEANGKTDRHGTFFDREFQDVYMYVPNSGEDVRVEDIQIQKEEVECVQYWGIERYIEALENREREFVPRSLEYASKLYPILRNSFGQ
jgi:isopentenyldiphosphate isomerase